MRLIRENPLIGRPVGSAADHADVREFPLPRMPFSVVTRVVDAQIEVLRIWDQRADRAEPDLRGAGPR